MREYIDGANVKETIISKGEKSKLYLKLKQQLTLSHTKITIVLSKSSNFFQTYTRCSKQCLHPATTLLRRMRWCLHSQHREKSPKEF